MRIGNKMKNERKKHELPVANVQRKRVARLFKQFNIRCINRPQRLEAIKTNILRLHTTFFIKCMITVNALQVS